MNNLPIVTAENYFSTECNMAYMGSSQFKAFQRCEAAALAEASGNYKPETTDAMLIGSYVDAYFSGEMPLFQAQHPELFKKDGSLKSTFLHANDIISRMEEDELYMLLMSGKKQVIKTGTIAGVPFKIKIDSLLDSYTCAVIANKFPDAAPALGMLDGAIVDQKVMRDMAQVWNEDFTGKVSFVEGWGYDLQGAIYQAIDGRMLPFILAVGTKEDSPDLAAINIPDADLEAKLHEVEDLAPRYQAIKEGRIAPVPCGKCPYCRARKKLTGIVSYKEVGE